MSVTRDPSDLMNCRTPNGGKPVRIEGWKFFVVRQAILHVVQNGIAFKELPEKVKADLGEKAAAVGDISWYTTTVKMEMEVRQELIRSKKQGRQWLRVGPALAREAD